MPFSFRKTFLTLSAVIAAASGASAIQTQVMIQGYLTNASGTPYTTAQATEFRVYQGGTAMTAGSGTLYYDETASITPSASGVFNYPLGSGTPTVAFLVVGAGGTIANVLSTTTFDTTSAVYLEISVGGIPVLPRLQMLGTPYAALTGTSENLKPTSQPLITSNYLQASSGTFTAAGNSQASIATSSGIIVNAGGVTAPFFSGTLYGNVAGTAGNVAAASVTPGTFGPGVLVPPANIVGGVTSTNTVNYFPLVQQFGGGIVASSGAFFGGVTAASGTFTASGNNQASIVTSSGIIVNAGGVTAPYFSGTLYGNVAGTAGNVAAGSVTPGIFGSGVLVPAANIVGGIASTNTVNYFPLVQLFRGGVVASSGSFFGGVTAASGTFTASGNNQASIVASSGIVVSAGGVTAPYFSGTLYGSVSGGAGSVAAGSVTPGIFGGGVLVPPANVMGGIASTNTANTFPLAQAFPGGVIVSSGSFTDGITAASATLTGSGNNQYSLAAASGIIVSAGGVTAPYFSGMLYGNVSGNAGSVSAVDVTTGTFGGGVLIPPANIVGGVASTNTVNYFPLVQLFRGGVVASSGTFFGGVTAASGTFTAGGNNQASIVASSGIIVSAGGVTAPFFNGTLYGNVAGTAGNVAAGNVTSGVFGSGVLLPPANVIGGIASTNTANTFPFVQTFPGGVIGSSGSFMGGITAASATLAASGNSQYSLAAASGIVVSAGGVTAPYFSGTLYGNVSGNAGSVSAVGVTSGTFGGGVLVPPANIVGGVASTNTVNYFPLVQLFPGGVVASSGSFFGGVTTASGTFTASGNNQASIVSSSGIIVSAGGVTAPYFSGTLYGSVSGGAGSVAAGNVTPGVFVSGVLVPPANVIGGIASTNTANTFPFTQTFPGGVIASSGSFTDGVTAASATLTGSGNNEYSLAAASGIIVSAGGVTAPYFAGTLYGNVSGNAGSVSASGVTTGTFGAGVLLPPTNIIGGIASTNTANTYPLVQTFQGGVIGSSGSFTGGIAAASGMFTASGNNQASIVTSSGIIVNGGGVTAPYFSGTLYGSVAGTAGNVAAGNVTPGALVGGVLVPPANVIGGIASTNTANTFPMVQTFPGGVIGSSASFANGITGASAMLTANGSNQYSLTTASGIIVSAGGVTAPYFSGTLYGNVSGNAGSVAAVDVAAGTVGGGVLVPAANIIGGVASTNTANTFPLAQSFPGGVTAASATLTSIGNGQYSLSAASGIVVSGGGVTAPYFKGTLYGNVVGTAGNVPAVSVTPGTFGGGVLVPPANIVGGVASTNTANVFTAPQTIQGELDVAPPGVNALEKIGAVYSGPTSGYSGNGQVTSEHTLAFRSWSNAFNDTLGVKLLAINKTAYGSSPWYFSQLAELHVALLTGGALTGDDTVDLFQFKSDGFHVGGGVVASSASFTNGMTASSGTFTGSGVNQASILASSGIFVSAGGVTAPYFVGTLYGNVSGTSGGVAGANVTGTVAVLNGGTGAATAAGAQANLGVPSTTGSGASGTWGIHITGNAATVTTNANLTGNVTSVGNATTIASLPAISGANLTGLIGANVTGNIPGSAANVTGTVLVANGGTGATSAAGAQTNLGVPSTTGSGASGTWGIHITGNAATVTTNANLTGNVISVGNATTIASLPAISGANLTSLTGANVTGNIPGNAANVTGTVLVANGGTGATTVAGAQTNLGVPSTTGSGASGTWGISITGIAPGMVPIGGGTIWYGTTEPVGWIECNGRSIPQTGTYAASWGSFNTAPLFAAVGTVWGSAGAGLFTIPDIRGIFPRGWNHGKSSNFHDPDASSRVAQYASGATGDAIGSYQLDQFKSHTHTSVQIVAPGSGVQSGPVYTGNSATTTGATGGSETRPENADVMYIMRVQ